MREEERLVAEEERKLLDKYGKIINKK